MGNIRVRQEEKLLENLFVIKNCRKLTLFSILLYKIVFTFLKMHGQVSVTLRSPQHKSVPYYIFSTWRYNSSKKTTIYYYDRLKVCSQKIYILYSVHSCTKLLLKTIENNGITNILSLKTRYLKIINNFHLSTLKMIS